MNKKDVHILVVDDEQGIRDLLSFELGAQGYQITTAQDGIEALEQVKKKKPQLVITDIMMPRMDGIATLAAVKEIDPAKEIPLLISSGQLPTEQFQGEAHIHRLQKPYSSKDLMNKIKIIFDQSQKS